MALVLALIVIVLLYKLFIQGWLFKLIILGGFCLAGRIVLPMWFPGSLATCITIGGATISWATTILAVIVILAMATTQSKEA